MTITLKQFKKFATDNDIFWYYNKPAWRTTPFDVDSKEWQKYNKEQLDEIRKNYLDNTSRDFFKPFKGAQPDYLTELNKLPKDIKKTWLEGDWHTNEPKSFASKMVKMQDGVNLHNRKKREETMKVNLEIAKICHQVNRDYCIENRLFAGPKWDETSTNIQESVISGVAEVIADPKVTAAEMHDKWLEYKASEGWKFDKVLNVKKKLHPNMVPFNKLSKVEQEKDRLFIRTVKREMKK